MVHFEPLPQPALSRVSDALLSALVDNRYDTLRAAVAYVTSSGVQELQHALNSSGQAIRWLTAFDWCRSEPSALDALNQRTLSDVRVHDGAQVVSRGGCVPTVSYHPKAFLFSGREESLLVVGSANLSRNGLRHGVEFDAAISVAHGTSREQSSWQRLDRARQWFDDTWSHSAQYSGLADRYAAEHSRRPRSAAVLEFGAAAVPLGRGFSAEQLAQLASAQTMWIEAGTLTAAASTYPGHQLMMRPMTRVFFGFGAEPVPRKTRIGGVSIRFDGALSAGLSLEFAHNSMDRLNLPAASSTGVASYDGKILGFTKAAIDGGLAFEMSVLGGREARRLMNMSAKQDLAFTMSSGRSFGFV